MWEAVETKARKIGIAKTKRGRKERRGRKEKKRGKKEEKEKT